MGVMGVNLAYNTLSWFLWSLLEMLAAAACITAVLCGGNVLPRSDFTLIFTLVAIFGVSILSFWWVFKS
jgi:hypothetical protein